VHSAGAWAAIGLLALHVAGALKHHLLDRDTVLWRMLPIVPRPKGS
jgi:cytochrome b561